MKKISAAFLRLFLILLLTGAGNRSFASHIFGIDLFYTYVSGNTYQVSLVVYGDCSGSAFPSLQNSTPQIKLYNGNVLSQTLNLAVQAPATGVNVTPVCPSDSNNTTCTNVSNPIPGIKRFTYTANVTISGTSSQWRFVFAGIMGTGVANAGRSNSITNIVIPTAGSGSLIGLTDTLNNLNGSNSSPTYTTIPTPFFCLNVPANFNPGAVDPNSDSLDFHLVPAIDANIGASVTYISPYTATNPLAVAAGTFLFNSNTGQLAFTPNITQKSLVVYNTEEYRNGILVGTSQREMTYVILGSCSDYPPGGGISNNIGGIINNSVTYTVCQGQGAFSFQINPVDSAGSDITVTAAGLPAGATFNISGNGTTNPQGTFAWNTNGVALGSYTFFVTFQNNACPLSSKQTLAYTIIVAPLPVISYSLISAATCTHKAAYDLITSGSGGPFTINVNQGTTTIQTINNVTGTVLDSLLPGTYTIQVLTANGCEKDTALTVTSPATIVPAVTLTKPGCPGAGTGSITATAAGGLAPYQFSIGTGSYSSSGIFNNLVAGTYIINIKDANGCVADTSVNLTDPAATIVNLSSTKPYCNGLHNGIVTVSGYNSVAPYQYAIGNGTFGTSGTFTNLSAGTYTITTKNANGCIVSNVVTLTDSLELHATIPVTNALCHNTATGSLIIYPSGAAGPYTYAVNSGAYGANNTFANLAAGTYTIHVRDSQQCYLDTAVTLTQPLLLTASHISVNVLCYSDTDGYIIEHAAGGTQPYGYAFINGISATSDTFNNLAAGTYYIQVQDAHGCTVTDTAILTQPAAVRFVSITSAQPACYGTATGSFTVTAAGGIQPYNYATNLGSYGTDSVINNLNAGTYTLYVSDSNHCTIDTSLSLSQPDSIIISASIKNSTCATLKNGSVIINAAGGTPAYTFAEDNNGYSSISTFRPLPAGTYTFYIKDANGCVRGEAITIIDSFTIAGNFIITPVQCYGQANGAIAIDAAGGTAPYGYSIDTSSYNYALNTFYNIYTGNHDVHIVDANGCKLDTTLTVTQPDSLSVSLMVTPNECTGYEDGGAVAATVTGGTPPYHYIWSVTPFTTAATINGLANGAYQVWVADTSNCADSAIGIVKYDDCCTPFIPSAFTPNGDGKNDVLHILYKGDMKLENFSIYNRYGQRVYNTIDLAKGWDGTFNGTLQDLGVYFYYVKAICGNGGDHEIELHGDVTLIR